MVTFRSASLRCLKAFQITRSQARIYLYSAPEARCTSSPSFFYRGGTSRGRAMEGDREPAEGAGVGDGKPKRATITDKTQAGNMRGFFHSLPPGTKAAAAPPPPGPKATTQAQSDYQNAPRAAYDDGPGAGTDDAINRRTSSGERTVRTFQRGAGNGTRHGHRFMGELVDERRQHLGVTTQPEQQLTTSGKASIKSMG